MKKICPKCNSADVKIVRYMTINCLVCNRCGYDERNLYEVFPQEKKSQKAKGSYTVYKSGGHGRIGKL